MENKAEEYAPSGIDIKLFEIQKLGLKYKKESKSHYGKYLNLDDLLEKVLPGLNERGLLITNAISKKGSLVTTIIDTETGTGRQSFFPLPEGVKPQEVGSAITYGKRYNTGALLNIVIDEDTDDGNKEDINFN